MHKHIDIYVIFYISNICTMWKNFPIDDVTITLGHLKADTYWREAIRISTANYSPPHPITISYEFLLLNIKRKWVGCQEWSMEGAYGGYGWKGWELMLIYSSINLRVRGDPTAVWITTIGQIKSQEAYKVYA